FGKTNFSVTENRLSACSSPQTPCLPPDGLAQSNVKINARKFSSTETIKMPVFGAYVLNCRILLGGIGFAYWRQRRGSYENKKPIVNGSDRCRSGLWLWRASEGGTRGNGPGKGTPSPNR